VQIETVKGLHREMKVLPVLVAKLEQKA